MTVLLPLTVPTPPAIPHSATLSIELLLGRQELVGLQSRLSQESLRGISSLGVKLGLWFKSLASLVKGWEPPMLEVLSLPLLECSLEDSLVPESETWRSIVSSVKDILGASSFA